VHAWLEDLITDPQPRGSEPAAVPDRRRRERVTPPSRARDDDAHTAGRNLNESERLMRRIVLFVVLFTVALLVTSPAINAQEVPGNSSAFGASKVVWQQRLFAWLFGNATNPLLQEGFCGQVIDHVFYFNAAAAPVVEANCVIPTGTPMVASPGGTIEWAPLNGATDQALLTALNADFAGISNPSATLDGNPLDVTSGFANAGAYTIPVEAGSLIPTVDPTFPPTLNQTRVASAAWIIRIHPLPPGQHELVLADDIAGQPFTATFHITVQPAGK
jgi:hypothetical protein